MASSGGDKSFWEHLDELRGVLVRIVLAMTVLGVVAFCLKDWLFAIVFAPKEPYFVTNRIVERLTHSSFEMDLINLELAQQFIVHIKMSLWMGLLVVMPYVVYLLFRFVSPALYEGERRFAVRACVGGYVLFMLGVAVSYFVIFPLTFRFLADYRVSETVSNVISLTSYINTLLVMSLVMGVVFELPVVAWLLAKMGALRAEWMARYRRHAIVVILIASAIITPTGDPFTLSLVALPVYLLYEFSVLLVRRTVRGEA